MKYLYILAISSLFLTAACEDPAADKPAAEVTEASKQPEAAADDTGSPEGAITFDATAGKVGWLGSKVTGSHTGGFEKFSGWAKKGEGGWDLNVVIDMTSVTSDTEKLTDHLKTDDFFLVEEHPEATFVTTKPIVVKDGKAEVTGDLTMRGVTKQITFPAEVKETDGALQVKSEFKIKRFDWGIAYKGMEDDLIRDDVVIQLDLKLPNA